jgi:cytochrome c-type biogenesis protein CcmH
MLLTENQSQPRLKPEQMVMIKKSIFAITLVLFVGLFAAGIVSAQQPTPSDDQVNAIAKQLYCPVCENIPLDVCPTQACAQWRELIRQKLAEGWGEQQIKDYFVQQYGARVLGTPPAKGINWLVYVIPPLVIIAGFYILFRAFRSWTRPTQQENLHPPVPSSPVEQESPQDEYIKQMEDQVRKN